ncbi:MULTISPECIES: helix-turn-helix domain-containing protein [unclassified Collinsella]|uniref:helix-turn-helix domain-containing protein n=1 Tax=unclassified Collinsella TaxID=2637548 RepID=UPI003F937815
MRVAEIAERVGCDPESAYSKFADTREGTRFHNMQWPTFVTDENYRLFCKALADYANSEEGPQSNGRHELFLSVHELFEKGNEIGGAPKKRHYNLDKSFIGTDEANLMLLKAAHKGMTQQAIAAYLGCSRTAVQKRLSALADGVRFGDSYIKAEPTSRGGLKSTAHPIFLPLRLHEVYLMLSALGEFRAERSGGDPERVVADDLARRIYYQLSDYAKGGIDKALDKRGVRLAGLRPDFDSSKGVDDSDRIVMYEKMGLNLKVGLVNGDELEGRYARHADLQKCVNAAEIGKDDRCFVLRLLDGTYRAVYDSQVVSVAAAPGD